MQAFTGNRDVDKLILSYLSYPDLIQAIQVNKYISGLCDSYFWRNKLKKDFPLRSKFINGPNRELEPRKLYEKIMRKSRVIEMESICPEFHLNSEDILCKELLNEITIEIFDNIDIFRGDILRLGGSNRFGNAGKFIWTGEKIIELDYTLDDYGNIPKEFTFPEFSLDHFHDSVSHNAIIWLSPDSLDEAVRNFAGDKTTVSDLYHSYDVLIQIDITENNLKQHFFSYPFLETVFDYQIKPYEYIDSVITIRNRL